MSATRLLVLGVVRRHGTAHGYLVSRELLSWGADGWANVRPGSIYHALRQLSRCGLLVEAGLEQSQDGPPRLNYALTPAGDMEFVRLLREALRSAGHRRDVLGAAVAFLTSLPRDEVIELLRERLRALHAERDEVIPLVDGATCRAEGDAAHVPELFRLWLYTTAGEARWTEGLIARLEAGAYDMPGDSARAAALAGHSQGRAGRPG